MGPFQTDRLLPELRFSPALTPPLRSADVGGECNIPTAQPSEEIPAHWTEIIFIDGSTATPALLAKCFDGWGSNAILFIVITCNWPSATIRMFFGPLYRKFLRSSCSPHSVNHVLPSESPAGIGRDFPSRNKVSADSGLHGSCRQQETRYAQPQAHQSCDLVNS